MSNDRIYFLHIPKTAGTSATEFFYDACKPETISPHRTWDTLVGATQAELESWKVYIGHFAGVLPLWLHYWPRTVTIIRDPVARVVSAIKHVRRSPLHPYHALAAGLSVSEFCRHPVLGLSVENMQARYLASLTWAQALTRQADAGGRPIGDSVNFHAGLHALERGPHLEDQAIAALESLESVGITEHLSTTLRLFAKTLCVPEPNKEYYLNTSLGDGRDDLQPTSDDYAEMESITEIDRAVYQRGLQIFRENCARYGLSSDAVHGDSEAMDQVPRGTGIA